MKLNTIGPGIVGLYIVLTLENLAVPGVTYKILEARDPVGGTIKTYHFSDTLGNYIDNGAMELIHGGWVPDEYAVKCIVIFE